MKIQVLTYWEQGFNCKIAWFFSSHSSTGISIDHSYRESQFLMKGRPKISINLHILPSIETKEQMESWDIKYLSSTGWVAIIFIKVLSKTWSWLPGTLV